MTNKFADFNDDNNVDIPKKINTNHASSRRKANLNNDTKNHIDKNPDVTAKIIQSAKKSIKKPSKTEALSNVSKSEKKDTSKSIVDLTSKTIPLPKITDLPLDYAGKLTKAQFAAKILDDDIEFINKLRALHDTTAWVIIRLLVESYKTSEHCHKSLKAK